MGTVRIRQSLVSCLVVSLLLFSFVSGVFADIVRDGTIGPNAGIQPTGPDYLIPASHGVQSGSNLFHSFSTFNIGTGQTATFTPDGSSGSISNIISRVTGGSVSNIDGLLSSSQIAGANFFLLNPAGILIGPNARLDVGGSIHLSTADYLKFENLEKFYANPSSPLVLSVAEPAAFGFLNANPAAITGDRAYLTVPEGKTISLIGGDISYNGDPLAPGYILDAPGGRINIVSVASPGEVNLALADSGISSFTRLGNVTLNDYGFINVEGLSYDEFGVPLQPSGSVHIRGGDIVLKDSGLYARGNPAGIVDIRGGSLKLDNFSILAYSFGDADHPGESFHAELSQNLRMINASSIESVTFGSGRAGDVRISAQSAILGDDLPGAGPYPDLGIYGTISANSNGSGHGGNILFDVTGEMIIQNGFFVTATSLDHGNSGNITLKADTLKFFDQGNIASNAYGYGNGGIVDVTAKNILISGKNELSVVNSTQITGVGAQTEALDSAVSGGKILITTDNLQVLDGGRIETVIRGPGKGADVVINAKYLKVDGFVADFAGVPPYFLSSIDGRVLGSNATGTGGNITVRSDALQLANGGVIRTGLYGDAPGNAGNITVNAKTIDIASRGQIYADSFRGTGNSGDIAINAATMTITGAKNILRPEPLDFDFTGLSTTTNSGTGGNINVNLTGNLTLAATGGIKADTQGTGLGGSIRLAAANVALSSGTSINSASSSNDLEKPAGNAGNISITAANTVLLRDASITSEAARSNGGEITIAAPNRISLINSVITAKVQGDATTLGGKIFIDPQFVVMKNSTIDATAVDGTGGTIRLVANTFLADPQSSVIAFSEKGINGTVDIQAPINNISGLLSPLSSDYVNASALLRERCIARIREGGAYSSFVVGGRDGLPMEPGNSLPSLMY